MNHAKAHILSVALSALFPLVVAFAALAQEPQSVGGNYVVRSDGDNAWVLNSVTGALRLCRSRQPGDAGIDCSNWSGPQMYATISVDCGGKTFKLSTGTKHTKCVTDVDGQGAPIGGRCSDGSGNAAVVTCAGGTGACSSTKAGSCTAE